MSAARNISITTARHDWIVLLDSDDIWHQNKLERQITALGNAPDYLICHSDEIWSRNGVRVNFQHCLPLCAISPSSTMIHRSLFEETGLFDETCQGHDQTLMNKTLKNNALEQLVNFYQINEHIGTSGQPEAKQFEDISGAYRVFRTVKSSNMFHPLKLSGDWWLSV